MDIPKKEARRMRSGRLIAWSVAIALLMLVGGAFGAGCAAVMIVLGVL